MELFEKLTLYTSQAQGDVRRKTQDISELGRLSQQLHETKKAKQLLLEKIGERYVLLHGAEDAPDFAELMHPYRKAEAEEAALQARIRGIKGIRQCKSCGGEIPSKADFCQNCGAAAPTEEEAPEDSIKCARCREFVPADMKFCINCGYLLDRQKPKPRCSNCGTVLSEKMRFCSKCGTPVQQTAEKMNAEEAIIVSLAASVPAEPTAGSVSEAASENMAAEECVNAAAAEETTAEL